MCEGALNIPEIFSIQQKPIAIPGIVDAPIRVPIPVILALAADNHIQYLFGMQAEGGLSVAEVASATGVGAETAKTRLRYAKARLRTLLAGWSTS